MDKAEPALRFPKKPDPDQSSVVGAANWEEPSHRAGGQVRGLCAKRCRPFQLDASDNAGLSTAQAQWV